MGGSPLLTAKGKLHCQESKLTSAKYSAASSTAMLPSPAVRVSKLSSVTGTRKRRMGAKEERRGVLLCERVFRMESVCVGGGLISPLKIPGVKRESPEHGGGGGGGRRKGRGGGVNPEANLPRVTLGQRVKAPCMSGRSRVFKKSKVNI